MILEKKKDDEIYMYVHAEKSKRKKTRKKEIKKDSDVGGWKV